MPYVLLELPYAYDALEPYYDEQTLRLHHDRHHKSYVDGLNNAEINLAEARKKGDYALIKHWLRELSFHGSGHILHTLFWENMAPAAAVGQLSPELSRHINHCFDSFEDFRSQFGAAAAAVEGSGWAVLGWNLQFQKLEILQAEKHQNLTQWSIIPLLVIDVWEHAYYLKYHNKRNDFIQAWWNIVNWETVSRRFLKAVSLQIP